MKVRERILSAIKSVGRGNPELLADEILNSISSYIKHEKCHHDHTRKKNYRYVRICNDCGRRVELATFYDPTIPAKIKAARLAQGKRLIDVSFDLKINSSALSSYENTRRSLPPVHVKSLLKYFNL